MRAVWPGEHAVHSRGGASADSFATKPSRSIIQLAEKHLQSFSCPARSETVIKGDHTDWFLSNVLTLAADDFRKELTSAICPPLSLQNVLIVMLERAVF